MNSLTTNPQTGFIESTSPNRKSFDSDKKLLLLDLALKTAEAGNLPDLPSLTKSVNVSLATFWSHYNQDTEFKEQYDEVLRYCEHTLANVMYNRGKTPGGFMDRIAWLKRHFKEWRDDHKTEIIVDVGQIKKGLARSTEYIDGEIVK